MHFMLDRRNGLLYLDHVTCIYAFHQGASHLYVITYVQESDNTYTFTIKGGDEGMFSGNGMTIANQKHLMDRDWETYIQVT